ncbi:GumC family protein [Mesonia mobilis]|uniref:non-specific protein-tyrosine kinase n=2 Tax=Mesonia mobilis TaxID=369791 RepID=A0ABQ3BWA8_9FLAO|nr:tyrosine protein kinase [Mesonia mobilis]
MMNAENQRQYTEEENEDLKFLIFKYLKNWPYFLISVIIFILIAVFYLKYSTPIYQTSTSVKVLKDDEGGVDLSGLSASTTLFNYSKVNLENEIQIFKSRRMLGRVIDSLQLTTTVYKVGSLRDELLFGEEIPFKIEYIENDVEERSTATFNFSLRFKANNSFEIHNDERNISVLASLNDTIREFDEDFIIKPTVFNHKINNSDEYKIYKIDRNSLLSRLSNEISIEAVGDKSDVLRASVKGANKTRNETILNTLVKVFNQDGVEDKRLISKRTKEFVEERLKILVQDLDTVESGLVEFKKDRGVVNVEASVEELFTKEATSESEKFNIETQLAISKDFRNLLVNQSGYTLLPANLGIESESVNRLTNTYNELISNRNRLLSSSTEENPMVLKLNEELDRIQDNILVSLKTYLQALTTSYQRLRSREGRYTGEINNLPQVEKELKGILRQQGIKERLYVFLLQKREEAALSYAITSPTIKIVDFAYTGSTPISPKRNMILLGAFLIGLGLPFGFLYLKFLLDTKVNNRAEIEKELTGLSVFGEVPQLSNSQPKMLKRNDQSALAEAFRIFRTNLLHQLKFSKNQDPATVNSKVIYVTSSIKGEGKTFTANNLARVIASSNKKVLLIGADLRNPQIHMYYDFDRNLPGVSDYLFNENLDIRSIIQKDKSDFKNLDILSSGSVPPNPAELLVENRFEELIDVVKSIYDYVIVDTAPTIYVTDTFLISKYADVTVYVVKQGLTEKKLLHHIKEVNNKKKLNHIALVLNGVVSDTNFGYGYGYVYNDTKKPFYKFW